MPPKPAPTTATRGVPAGPKSSCRVGRTSASVDHELEQVAVGITDIDARRGRSPAADALDRALLDAGARADEALLQRAGRACPHEAQIATGRHRCGRAQGEVLMRPDLRPVEVDHLLTGVH